MTGNAQRSLTQEEHFVLGHVQELWGSQNTEAEVFFTEAGEAALFVKAPDGTSPVCVVLTNLGRWHADGSINLQELRDQISGVPTSSLQQSAQQSQGAWARFRAALRRLFGSSPPAA